jgi:hypothetical protein
MATKTTTNKAAPKAKAAPKKATEKKAKTEAKAAGPRHPKARTDAAGGKAELAKTLASALATDTDSSDVVEGRLKTASNTQLLRLQKVVATVKAKWGSREKLIQAILDGAKKSKDKDYVAKLATFSLPRLVDLAQSAARRSA